ncbi:response regulator [Metallibacterium sp.]|jgi:two-component system KDP operon response regulator KdpE|uniref:response regulator n=1 Tax=Metallibacterium sp. TaxID=2940281 RepID=UPI002611D080|nr:response regulator [Metallibacterium sp.]
MTEPVAGIVLIEDDPQIRRFLVAALEIHGYAPHEAATAAEGQRQVTMRQPDLVILDLGLPDLAGLDLIKRLREWYTRPILVLSARTQEHDKVAALDCGADDYLTKPFGIEELLARLRAALRHLAGQHPGNAGGRIEAGSLLIDAAARRVLKQGTDVHLTPREYQLLLALASQRGKVLTHRQLLREVWGPAHVESPHYLRIYMRALRAKIEDDPARPRWLLTEIGIGYRFADDD